jgi:hypothetical protein
MADIFDFKGLSDSASIGKILVLASIPLTVVGLCILAVITAFLLYTFWLGILALGRILDNEFREAGILALIGSLLAPLDLIALGGGLLCMISPEAQGEKTATSADMKTS